jgi:hypothetical protein
MIELLALLARRLLVVLGLGGRLAQDAWLARVADLPLTREGFGAFTAAGASPAAFSLTLLLALPLAVGLVASRLAGVAATVWPACESRRLAQRSGPPTP